MENDIWNEISSFLNQLRCENINRESYIYFQELANIQLKKKMEKEKVNKLLDHISYEDREKLKQYGEILEEEAFVSEQRAYCQGYVDCIQLLAGLGLLKKSTDMVIVFIPLILNIGNYQLFIGILQVLFCIISSVYVRNKRIRI